MHSQHSAHSSLCVSAAAVPSVCRRAIYWLVATVVSGLPTLLYFHGETTSETAHRVPLSKMKANGKKKKKKDESGDDE